MKTKELNRHYLLRMATRVWCPMCGVLRAVTDYFAGVEQVQLECNHRRQL